VKSGIVVTRYVPLLVALAFAGMAHGWGQGQVGASGDRSENNQWSKPKAVIYVMPSALVGPAPNDGTQMLLESAHEGRAPQVAKIYQELQHAKSCQGFYENIVKEKADYFLLLEHGGGVGNRWAVSNKDGNVIATGQSFKLGSSVNDACRAIGKDWQQRPPSPGK
jgi:hypothetical protein